MKEKGKKNLKAKFWDTYKSRLLLDKKDKSRLKVACKTCCSLVQFYIIFSYFSFFLKFIFPIFFFREKKGWGVPYCNHTF